MSLKEGKFYFDNMFSTLWTQTPVHYAGQEFDAAGLDKWINPTYRPSRTVRPFLSSTDTVTIANVYIPCWAENDVDVMELMDDVIAFMETNVSKPVKITGTSIIDHGWDDSNKVFGIIMVGVIHSSSLCAIASDEMLQFMDSFDGSFQI